LPVTDDTDLALGRRKAERQVEFWIPTADLPQSPGHPFCEQLNQVLAAFNLHLNMRQSTAFGTPRGWADARRVAVRRWCALWQGLVTLGHRRARVLAEVIRPLCAAEVGRAAA
jgi:hypothetical protein